MLKSATFMIGILLALGAFVGFLLLGNFLAPPPAQVVVALRDIPPYTPLDQNMLGVDAQHLNGQVLATLVRKKESSINTWAALSRRRFLPENLSASLPSSRQEIRWRQNVWRWQ